MIFIYPSTFSENSFATTARFSQLRCFC